MWSDILTLLLLLEAKSDNFNQPSVLKLWVILELMYEVQDTSSYYNYFLKKGIKETDCNR